MNAISNNRPTAVIVGNGSSVDTLPAEFWQRCTAADVMLVGTNRVLAARALQEVAWDALVIRDTYRNLWFDQRVGAQYHDRLWKPATAWKVGPAYWRVTDCDEYLRFVDGWQHQGVCDDNGERAVLNNASVVLMAANWAWLMGVRRIFLTGTDYCGSHFGMLEPYDVSTGLEGRYDRPKVPEAIARSFAAAAQAVASRGGEMKNLSDPTRLESVESASWQDV